MSAKHTSWVWLAHTMHAQMLLTCPLMIAAVMPNRNASPLWVSLGNPGIEARQNYFFALALVGSDIACPSVQSVIH